MSDPLSPQPPGEPQFDPHLGAWVLSRYTDVAAALREPALWPVSSRPAVTEGLLPDEDARQQLRRRVLQAFSPQALRDWQARMENIADTLIFDRPVDLVSEFAEPWCLAAAEIVTGSPFSERQKLLAAARIVSDAAAAPMDDRLRREATAANADLDRHFEGSAVPMAAPVFVALSRTVACLLANGWLALFRHPAQLIRLHECPDRISTAIEEILRFAGLPQAVFRYALRSVELCGLPIAEGDRVMLRLSSANRDPTHFARPDNIDFGRREAAQLSLGFGVHSCTGAALIRMTAATATRRFVNRFWGAKICAPVEWRGGEGFRFAAALRVAG